LRLAAKVAAKSPSAIPTPTSIGKGSAELATSATRWQRAGSPPKYRSALRTSSAQSPGRLTSIAGTNVAIAATTGSKARASCTGSRALTTRPGHRLCASRRRRPILTPSRRAAAEQAITWLPEVTATGTSGGIPRATTGQSGHQATSTRLDPPITRRSPLAMGLQSSRPTGIGHVARGDTARREAPLQNFIVSPLKAPSGPGSHAVACRSRAAARRPDERIVTRRRTRVPTPALSPSQPSVSTSNRRSGGSGQCSPTTRTEPLCRARLARRRASAGRQRPGVPNDPCIPWNERNEVNEGGLDGQVEPGGQRTTRSRASSNVAVTSNQLRPGRGTRTR